MSRTPPSNRFRNRVHRIRLLLISVLVISAAPLRAQENGFQCEDHNLFVDRLSAVPSQPLSPDSPGTKILASQNFTGFAKYGFESVRLIIRFDQDPGTASAPYPTGDIRISAAIQSRGGDTGFRQIEIQCAQRGPQAVNAASSPAVLSRIPGNQLRAARAR